MGNQKETIETGRMEEPQRVWNRKYVTLLIVNLLIMLGNYMLRPIISNYALELGATLSIAGVIAGVAFAVATVLRPVTGYLADRLNKKTSLLIAMIVFVVASLGCAISDSIVLVGIFCAMQGISLSFQAIGVTALVTLCVPRSRIGTAMGWMSLNMTVSMAIGPGITASVAAWGGYQASFVLGGILCGIGLIILIFFKAPPGAEGTKGNDEEDASKSKFASIVSKAFHLPTVPMAVAAVLAIWAPSSISMLLLTVEGTGYLTGAAWYFPVYAIAALGARPLAGWLSDRSRSAIIAVPLLILGAVGVVVPIFGRDVIAMVVCGVLMGVGAASAASVIQAESVRGVDVEHLGRATNTYYLGVDLGCALGAWAGGFLMQVGTPALMFGFDAFVFVAAAAVVAFAYARRKRAN